jgi:hypothetical protein
MDLRSGRHLRSGSGADRIRTLHDDLLLLILSRLRCAATAARTAVLSRRWRNLWTLLSHLVFRDVKYFSLKSALARHVSPVVTLLEIHVPEAWLLVGDYLNPEDVVSLLRAAARLEPEQFVFSIPNILTQGDIGVPCFRRASSIVLESHNTVALVVKFSTLELHLTTSEHVFGPFVFHLIGMNLIRTAMRRLKVILHKSWVIIQ